MSDFDKERRKAKKVQNCMKGSLALGALSCRLTALRRGLEAGREFDTWKFREVVSLASDVREAFGGKSSDAVELARNLKEFNEKAISHGALEAVKKAEEAIPTILNSASDQCGRALRAPAPRKPKEAVAPPAEA